MTDDLLKEIERVNSDAHSTIARDGTSDFEELLDLRTAVLRTSRIREEEAIANLSDRIGREHEKQIQTVNLKSQIAQKQQLIANYTKDRVSLVPKGGTERMARLNALLEAAEHVRKQIRLWSYVEQSSRSLQSDVADFRTNRAPETLRAAKDAFKAADLNDEEWERFRHIYKGDVDNTLSERLTHTQHQRQIWRGNSPNPNTADQEAYLTEGTDLKHTSLALLEAEIGRVQDVSKTDNDTANRFKAISAKINDENATFSRD